MKHPRCLFIILIILTLHLPGTICLAENNTGEQEFIHRWNQDSVNWSKAKGIRPDIKETDLEWPAERLGIIGPIVLTGGTGFNAYLMIYDPAGILVGKINKKEALENPEILNSLMDLAYRRARIQNRWSLKMMQKEAVKNLDALQGLP